MAIRKQDALLSLREGAEWVYRDGEIEWLDSEQTQPSDEEIDEEVIRLKSVYDAQEYARDRQSEYPSIQDQLDYIYHNSITKWKSDMIKPVKDAHPKP